MAEVWTPERVDRLKELWAAGQSGSMIANELQTTRNAVIGKAHRMRLDGRRTTTRKQSAQQFRAVLARRERAKQDRPKDVLYRERTERKKSNVFAGGTEQMEPVISDPPGRFILLDLEPNQCRWASGEDDKGRHLFCGAEKLPGCPYCESHAARAFEVREARRNVPAVRRLAVGDVFVPA